jgi:tetratricopeptide (TPR) repeat protein
LSSVESPKRRIPLPFLIVGVVVLALIVGSLIGKTTDEERAKELVQQAEVLTRAKLDKFEANEPLDPEDRPDLEKAVGLFHEVEQILHSSYKGFLGAGYVQVVLEDWPNALDSLRAALARPPRTLTADDKASIAQTHYLYARALISSNRAREAEKEASEALAFERTPNFLCARASARIQLHKLEDAQKDLLEALTLAPGHTWSQSLLKFISNMGDKS